MNVRMRVVGDGAMRRVMGTVKARKHSQKGVKGERERKGLG